MPRLFDIGANKGRYAQELAKTKRFNEIICVEPARACIPCLIKIRSLVASWGVQMAIVQLAASECSGATVILHEGNSTALSTLHPEWLDSPRFANLPDMPSGEACSYPVKTVSLDLLIRRYGMPDLIKIDVECHEEQVLLGLSQKVPLLCFEWAIENADSVQRSLERLKTLGFTKVHVQFGDAYTYQPSTWQEITPDVCLEGELDWGMIWVR